VAFGGFPDHNRTGIDTEVAFMAGGIPAGFQPLGCVGDGAQGGRESGGSNGIGLWTDDGHVLYFYNETEGVGKRFVWGLKIRE
jgi:hypothetical protein